MDEKEIREKYDDQLNKFGFKYDFIRDYEYEIAIHYKAKDYENPEKSVYLLFRINKETGKIYVYAIYYIKQFESYKIPLNELFDVLNASYEKGKGFSVKKFIDNLVD